MTDDDIHAWVRKLGIDLRGQSVETLEAVFIFLRHYVEKRWNCLAQKILILNPAQRSVLFIVSNEGNKSVEDKWKCEKQADAVSNPVEHVLARLESTIFPWLVDQKCHRINKPDDEKTSIDAVTIQHQRNPMLRNKVTLICLVHIKSKASGQSWAWNSDLYYMPNNIEVDYIASLSHPVGLLSIEIIFVHCEFTYLVLWLVLDEVA